MSSIRGQRNGLMAWAMIRRVLLSRLRLAIPDLQAGHPRPVIAQAAYRNCLGLLATRLQDAATPKLERFAR
jgi:hypothetical protein